MYWMFHDQIGKNVEVYIDNMLVKSKEEDNHLKDLEKTFNTLRKYQMKLNPSKCAFGVSSGKFLGFMVLQRGIEANPRQNQSHLRNAAAKEYQRDTGANWKDSGAQSLRLSVNRQMPALLQSTLEGF
jgi:hypothetical protein